MSSQQPSVQDAQHLTSQEIRMRIRAQAYNTHTSGLAPGKLQCNLAILPEVYALDFLRFCLRNPKPCPLVGVSETGDPMLPTLGRDIDIRTDVPRYRVFRNGALEDEVPDISGLWSDDLATVALGTKGELITFCCDARYFLEVLFPRFFESNKKFKILKPLGIITSSKVT